MRAVLCKYWGGPDSLVIEDLPPPRPGQGEVVVGVKACSVSFSDVLKIQGRYQLQPAFPFSPGNEFVGVVARVGDGVADFQPGDVVRGRSRTGSCAEEVVTSAGQLMHIPAGMDFAAAAAFGSSFPTSYHALRDRARLLAGETLVVLGASGGVGLAAVQLGKAMGARVIACASTQGKLDTCRRFGADDTINYESENLRERIKELTNDRGVDVVYDPVGDKYAEPALRSMAWGGRYLVVGFAAGGIPRIALNLPLLKGASIVGVSFGGMSRNSPGHLREIFAELADMFIAGKITPYVSAIYPLERTAEALVALMGRTAQGKIVVVTGAE